MRLFNKSWASALVAVAITSFCAVANGQTAEQYARVARQAPVPAPTSDMVLSGQFVGYDTHGVPIGGEQPHGGNWSHGGGGFAEACCELRHHSGGWYGGGEFLSIRPSFSDGVAYLQRDSVGSGQTFDQLVDYDFSYEGAGRAFVGYRFCDCGGQLSFTYTGIENDASVMTDPVPTNQTTIYAGHLETNADEPGETLSTSLSVDLDVYDFDYTRTITLGQPLSACQANCGGCPRWDVAWQVGVRIADVSWDNETVVDVIGGSIQQASAISMEFSGVGPRVGFSGRRYFGQGGCWSLYAQSQISLLVGDYDVSGIQSNNEAEIITGKFASRTRVIPVTEIEVGGSWRFNPCLTISAGYMVQAWHDLGMTSEIQGAEFGAFDDANILAFDGIFVRGEWNF